MSNKIKSFTDLKTWQEARLLVLLIYKTTNEFPKSELFVLTSQMRRSAISIASNIAEGFGRFTYPDKIRFYNLAHGSLIELKNQIIISNDLGYIKNNKELIINKCNDVHYLLLALIKKSKNLNS
jgi:four helix bundle protein